MQINLERVKAKTMQINFERVKAKTSLYLFLLYLKAKLSLKCLRYFDIIFGVC
jgi:hypothetical protein